MRRAVDVFPEVASNCPEKNGGQRCRADEGKVALNGGRPSAVASSTRSNKGASVMAAVFGGGQDTLGNHFF